jgi:large subunit ribosomal protein L15
MPLQMRLPKVGFNSPNRKEYVTINLDQLTTFAEKYGVSSIDKTVLREKQYIKKNDKVKILGRGELSKKLDVTVHACSASAKAAIEEKGGTVNII